MKKQFETPKVTISELKMQELLITASPGIGGDFTNDMTIDSKGRGGYVPTSQWEAEQLKN